MIRRGRLVRLDSERPGGWVANGWVAGECRMRSDLTHKKAAGCIQLLRRLGSSVTWMLLRGTPEYANEYANGCRALESVERLVQQSWVWMI